MSYRVLVIPEDPTYNGAILKPLAARMLAECGKARCYVQVLADPRMTGLEMAVDRLGAICERYRHFDLLLLLVDADGKDRRGVIDRLEREARDTGATLLGCAAVQEVEVWLLAGHRQKLSQSWQEIRADVSVKENVFEAFLRRYGDPRQPGGGRGFLMEETLSNYRGLKELCPEVAELEQRIRALLREDQP